MTVARLVPLLALAAVAALQPQALARDGGEADETAAPVSGWRVGPAMAENGSFAYCFAESRFDNGQSLVIARSPRGEINIGLGMPAAHLTRGAAGPMTVRIDDGFRRDLPTVAADADMLVIHAGADRKLVEALTHGNILSIRGPRDTVAFELKGTGKTMHDLESCVADARSGKPAPPLGSVPGSSLQLPPVLKRLLAEAGFKTVGLMAAAAAPPGLGPVDYLWKAGAVTAGMAEFHPETGGTLRDLSDAALDRLRPHCGKTFTVRETDSDNLPGGSFRAVAVTCATGSGTSHVAYLFELGRGGLFKQFFFSAPDADAATRDRDAIAGVLKQAESR